METLNNLNDLIKSNSSALFRGLSGIYKSSNPSTDPLVAKSGQTLATNVIKLSEMANRREVLLLLQSSHWIRLAGILGASAVAMGAYGAHGLNPRTDIPIEYKSVFETANKYHFFHSLALLGVPLTRRPVIVGTLMITGMFVFCGTCYVYSLTQNKEVIKYTPLGGMALIMAWLAMIL